MLEVGPNGLPLLRQMGLVNRIPLPPELVEHFGRKNYHYVTCSAVSALKCCLYLLYYCYLKIRYAKLLHDGPFPQNSTSMAQY